MQTLARLSAAKGDGKKEGRELNAPPSEAPRSACGENVPSRALAGACQVGLSTRKFAVFRRDRSRSYAKLLFNSCSLSVLYCFLQTRASLVRYKRRGKRFVVHDVSDSHAHRTEAAEMRC